MSAWSCRFCLDYPGGCVRCNPNTPPRAAEGEASAPMVTSTSRFDAYAETVDGVTLASPASPRSDAGERETACEICGGPLNDDDCRNRQCSEYASGDQYDPYGVKLPLLRTIASLWAERDALLRGVCSLTESRRVWKQRAHRFRRDRDALREAVRDYLAALDKADAEAARAEQPGARAWSSAPMVRVLNRRADIRAALTPSTTETP